MKYRKGFVSNSSAASFYIYGWTFEELEPFGIRRWDQFELIKMLKEGYPDIDFTESSTPNSDWILGVGNSTSEFDHYYDGDWQNYTSPRPKKEEIDKLDKVAVDMGWPKPHMAAETWFDG